MDAADAASGEDADARKIAYAEGGRDCKRSGSLLEQDSGQVLEIRLPDGAIRPAKTLDLRRCKPHTNSARKNSKGRRYRAAFAYAGFACRAHLAVERMRKAE